MSTALGDLYTTIHSRSLALERLERWAPEQHVRARVAIVPVSTSHSVTPTRFLSMQQPPLRHLLTRIRTITIHDAMLEPIDGRHASSGNGFLYGG